jgi:hypothetical protein
MFAIISTLSTYMIHFSQSLAQVHGSSLKRFHIPDLDAWQDYDE